MTEKLKPCPFCGDKAKLYVYHYPTEDEAVIECLNDNCASRTQAWDNPEEAIQAWNTRKGETE